MRFPLVDHRSQSNLTGGVSKPNFFAALDNHHKISTTFAPFALLDSGFQPHPSSCRVNPKEDQK